MRIINKNKNKRNNYYGVIYRKYNNKTFLNIIKILKNSKIIKKIIFFKIDDLNINKDTIKGIQFINNHLIVIHTKIPKYIFNTVIHTKLRSINKMRQLRILKHIKVINPINRFNQSIVFDIINSFSSKYILPYTLLNEDNLDIFINKYNSIFLLPDKSNKNYITINKNNNIYTINDIEYDKNNLFNYIKKMIKHKPYLIMKKPNILEYNNLPLEVRVYVQKDRLDIWNITDIIIKHELLFNNSIYNKTAYLFKNVLVKIYKKDINNLELKLNNISLNIVTYLSHFIPNISSISLDYIIDDNDNPYLIKIGGFDEENYLESLNDLGNYNLYIKNTIDYLCKSDNNE